MSLIKISELFHFEKGSLQSTKCTPGKHIFITASSEWKTHNEYTHECEALVFAAAASGSLGRTHYVNDKFIASDLCFIITPKDEKKYPIDIQFYHLIFNTFKNDIVKNTKAGTSKEAIGLKSFGNYKLPYFEIEKQKETRGKFILLQESNIKTDTELIHQLDLIKQLRQAFLREAMQGKLCHTELVSASQETGQQLLEKIKAEKAQLIAEKKLKKEKELPPITEDEIPFEIPEHWAWCHFGNLATLINGDRGKNYPNREEYVDEGVPWINTGHIQPNGTLTSSTMNFITREKFNSLRSGKIQADDLVYCLRGATYGKTAFVEPYFEGAIASSLMIIRLNSRINKKFVYNYLKSDFAMTQLLRFNNGSAQPNLAANDVNLYYFPLPPLHEQEQIVAKLEELMAFCDGLEQSIKESQGFNEQLLQQVLREALQGG